MSLRTTRLSLLAAAAFALAPRPAPADVITPDSIVRPPPAAVGSANLTPITSPADLVTTQYAGLGLTYPTPPGAVPGTGPTAAVTRIGGVDVWAPAVRTEAAASSVAVINYGSTLTGDLAHPASSVTVEFVGPGVGLLSAFDAGGHLLGGDAVGSGPGPHGGELLTLTAPGISSFTVTGPLLPLSGPGAFPPVGLPWGVAQVGFTPVTAPEPAGLALAALGACSLLGYARRRGRPVAGA